MQAKRRPDIDGLRPFDLLYLNGETDRVYFTFGTPSLANDEPRATI
jgi:hypothetical protein